MTVCEITQRLEKAKRFYEIIRKDKDARYKLAYYEGENLVLLQKLGDGYIIKEETGPWVAQYFEEEEN